MYDLNNDGIQDVDEPIAPNVSVTLYDAATNMPVTIDANGNPIATILTDTDGAFLFEDLPLGSYYVIFDYSTIPNPDYYLITEQDANANGQDDVDSDADPVTGTSSSVTPPPATTDNSLGLGLICNVSVALNSQATICSARALDLNNVGALISPPSLGGIWQTAGDGTFDDDNLGLLGMAQTYTPGPQDIANRSVSLTLMTDGPLGPCSTVTSSILVTILAVDCGQFPWGGGE